MLTPAQIQAAQQAQHVAAHDPGAQARLVAGPGTGKSLSIAERVRWLLASGVPPDALYVVSFTRASARDLGDKIRDYCAQNAQPDAPLVSVTTLHSLALRILKAAGQLNAYPVDPNVMDEWEQEEVFDEEFSCRLGVTPTRCKDIRVDHEAFWNTNQWNPPNYLIPAPPITAAERTAFVQFHGPRSQLYAMVLPGEIVRKCVEASRAGILDPVELAHISHLIVDEFQDLNQIDQDFVNDLIAKGVRTFVAGDDDQSIYSFRYASPDGIQNFTTRYAGAGDHVLTECFRCTPAVVYAASAVMHAHAMPNRIPKILNSMYAASTPSLNGHIHRWYFGTNAAEAQAIAESCRDLIAGGVSPDEILILMSNSDLMQPRIIQALTQVGVPHHPAKGKRLADKDAGRLPLAFFRIMSNADDYLAYRALLGLMRGVGAGTCYAIATAVLGNGLNFKNLFVHPLPAGIFTGRRLTALNAARGIVAQIVTWQGTDTLAQRAPEISTIITSHLSPADLQEWTTGTAHLPPDMELGELRDYLQARDADREGEIIKQTLERLGQPVGQTLPPKVKMMTMHGAKGLSARVVFIPGLEEDILPGSRRRAIPGLVLEAARLLYVSISRARAACILTFSRRRWAYNAWRGCTASRFATCVGGPFVHKINGGGLTAAERNAIAQECVHL